MTAVRIQPCPRPQKATRPDGAACIAVWGATFDPAQDFALVSVRPTFKSVSIVRETAPGQYLGRDRQHRLVSVSSAGHVKRLSALEASLIEHPGANAHELEIDEETDTTVILDLASGRRARLDLLSEGVPDYEAARGLYYLELEDGGCAAVDAADYALRWLNDEIRGIVVANADPDLLLFHHTDYGAGVNGYDVVDKTSGSVLYSQDFRHFAPIAVAEQGTVPRVWGKSLESRPGWSGAGTAPRDTYLVRYNWRQNVVDKTRFEYGDPRLVIEGQALYALSGELDLRHPSASAPSLHATGLRLLDPDSLELLFAQDLPNCALIGDLIFAGDTLLLPGFEPPDWTGPGDSTALLVTFPRHPARGDSFEIESVPLTVGADCMRSAAADSYRVRYTGDSTRFFDLYTQLAIGLLQTAQRNGYFTEITDCRHHNPGFAGQLYCDVAGRDLTALETEALAGMFQQIEQELLSGGYVSGADRRSAIRIDFAAD